MKDISTNVRSNDSVAMLHLFEFEMRDFDGNVDEILYMTDHDIFVNFDSNEYVPLAITFDKLSEDFALTADSVSVTIDNINGAVSSDALSKEWRNNPCKITRVIYSPPSTTITGQSIASMNGTYDFGLTGEGSATYPRLDFNLDEVPPTFDQYVLFNGIIDTFSASEASLRGTMTTKFIHWATPYPIRTYNQSEFTAIADVIFDEIIWGGKKYGES